MLSPRPCGISVVIPCFNYGEFIGRAINSVLAQRVPYERIVVVDDGSTDDSLQVIRSYGDRIDVVVQENRGLLGACLAGLERVDSAYVHMLDADDTADPALVETCLPWLADQPVKVQFQLAAVDADGTPNGSVFPSFAPGYDTAAMRVDNRVIGFYQCPPTSGNLFHVPTLRRLHLEQEDPRSPLDGAGCAVMPYLGEVVSLSVPLAYYRTHGASMSNTQMLPTPAQCEKELTDFAACWESAARILGRDTPPFGDSTPLFVLERTRVRAALESDGTDVAGLVRYLGRLTVSNLPRWQRLVQGAWMTSLLVPSVELRTRLVHLRRSGTARPDWLRRLVGLIRR